MTRPGLRRALTVLLALGTLAPTVARGPSVWAASTRQNPPPGVDPSHATVSGRLVAKATAGGAVSPAACGSRIGVAATAINRGLVICTDDGKAVLLQISSSTQIFNRNWQRIGYARLQVGDALQAWGTLRADGLLVSPTLAIRDTSRPGSTLETVRGRLVAKPDGSPGGPVICGNRDQTGDAGTLALARGLVVCTARGKLVLLQISASSKLLSRDQMRVDIDDLTVGDTLSATGTLRSDGALLDPTDAVTDLDLRGKSTASQDFVAKSGAVLTLYVLKSDPGPVQGIIHATPGEPSHVTLCGGRAGAWSDLRQALTLDISDSLYNTRTATYVDTETVRIASCR